MIAAGNLGRGIGWPDMQQPDALFENAGLTESIEDRDVGRSGIVGEGGFSAALQRQQAKLEFMWI